MVTYFLCGRLIFLFTFLLQGDVGVPGFKGEAGPKGEPVSFKHIRQKIKSETFLMLP